MKLGIVGLPNVGKSTLFNSLTKGGAESANYPFCTIDPNVGIVPVPDGRLKLLGDFYVLPSSVHEFILIAVEDQDPQQLADLVRSANRSVVKDSEVLSDDLYICESGILNRVSFGGLIPECSAHVC